MFEFWTQPPYYGATTAAVALVVGFVFRGMDKRKWVLAPLVLVGLLMAADAVDLTARVSEAVAGVGSTK